MALRLPYQIVWLDCFSLCCVLAIESSFEIRTQPLRMKGTLQQTGNIQPVVRWPMRVALKLEHSISEWRELYKQAIYSPWQIEWGISFSSNRAFKLHEEDNSKLELIKYTSIDIH